MNKKELFGTLLGTLTGGIGFILLFVNQYDNKNIDSETLDTDLLIIAFMGSITGASIGAMFGKIVSECIESRSEREAYREFFESQRTELNSNQLVNETTSLLQEHIININNEENLLNTNNSSSHNHCNIL